MSFRFPSLKLKSLDENYLHGAKATATKAETQQQVLPLKSNEFEKSQASGILSLVHFIFVFY